MSSSRCHTSVPGIDSHMEYLKPSRRASIFISRLPKTSGVPRTATDCRPHLTPTVPHVHRVSYRSMAADFRDWRRSSSQDRAATATASIRPSPAPAFRRRPTQPRSPTTPPRSPPRTAAGLRRPRLCKTWAGAGPASTASRPRVLPPTPPPTRPTHSPVPCARTPQQQQQQQRRRRRQRSEG